MSGEAIRWSAAEWRHGVDRRRRADLAELSAAGSADAPTVIKVGGSLLERDDLPVCLGPVLEVAGEFAVLVAGGGVLADGVRDVDRNMRLGDELAHWLAIAAMKASGRRLAASLGLPCVEDLAMVRERRGDRRPLVLDCERMMRRDMGSARPLPANWDTTSDSIAALAASELGASECWLLKSCPPPAESLTECAEAGYVDPVLPALVDRGRTLAVLWPETAEIRR